LGGKERRGAVRNRKKSTVGAARSVARVKKLKENA